MAIHPDHLGYRIKRLHVLMSQSIDDVLKPHGLGRTQWLALADVRLAGELSQKELQRSLHVEAATLTGVIDTLVAKGWLERLASPTDRRCRVLRLTAEGVRRLDAIEDPIVVAEERLLEGIGPEEREAVRALLERMIENMERHR